MNAHTVFFFRWCGFLATHMRNWDGDRCKGPSALISSHANNDIVTALHLRLGCTEYFHWTISVTTKKEPPDQHWYRMRKSQNGSKELVVLSKGLSTNCHLVFKLFLHLPLYILLISEILHWYVIKHAIKKQLMPSTTLQWQWQKAQCYKNQKVHNKLKWCHSNGLHVTGCDVTFVVRCMMRIMMSIINQFKATGPKQWTVHKSGEEESAGRAICEKRIVAGKGSKKTSTEICVGFYMRLDS